MLTFASSRLFYLNPPPSAYRSSYDPDDRSCAASVLNFLTEPS
jgi:hypothetical protein